MAATQPGGDNSTNRNAGLGPICIDNGDCYAMTHANGNDSPLTVIPALVFALERGAVEDQRSELEVEAADPKVLGTLPAIPVEAHTGAYRRIYASATLTVSRQCGLTAWH